MKHLLFSALLVALLATGAHAEEEDAPERPRHHTGRPPRPYPRLYPTSPAPTTTSRRCSPSAS